MKFGGHLLEFSKVCFVLQSPIVLSVALHGCETRLMMRIRGHKGEERTRDWIKLNNEEHDNLFSSAYIIRVIKSVGK